MVWAARRAEGQGPSAVGREVAPAGGRTLSESWLGQAGHAAVEAACGAQSGPARGCRTGAALQMMVRARVHASGWLWRQGWQVGNAGQPSRAPPCLTRMRLKTTRAIDKLQAGRKRGVGGWAREVAWKKRKGWG